ncbi:hypothetical protein [Conexibacter woesei]|uniref:Uncharacterized protein n=1 Tax=Conexibacter woesei (strain DSM 14684 / CCUG 47730 / CIP 108061 / JCM 11494 / NBRC 100937 / ID131577) TaxID=469383 RepID=D3F227_CONWI|nr:hypothetical protein [Conexibacter woesei]ADB50202.1 hypothetical protein Cwoe_1776 [Conexibacter woesei DSM 14684]
MLRSRRVDEPDLHHQIFLETGFPNPMRKGDAGATRYAYPNGLPRERFVRAVKRAARWVRHGGRGVEGAGPPGA